MNDKVQSQFQRLLMYFDLIHTFIDCKVILLVVFMTDIWNHTSNLADLLGRKQVAANGLLNEIWRDVASPYIKWIFIVILFDIFIQSFRRRLIHD